MAGYADILSLLGGRLPGAMMRDPKAGLMAALGGGMLGEGPAGMGGDMMPGMVSGDDPMISEMLKKFMAGQKPSPFLGGLPSIMARRF